MLFQDYNIFIITRKEVIGASSGTRTHNILITSQTLYQLELSKHMGWIVGFEPYNHPAI